MCIRDRITVTLKKPSVVNHLRLVGKMSVCLGCTGSDTCDKTQASCEQWGGSWLQFPQVVEITVGDTVLDQVSTTNYTMTREERVCCAVEGVHHLSSSSLEMSLCQEACTGMKACTHVSFGSGGCRLCSGCTFPRVRGTNWMAFDTYKKISGFELSKGSMGMSVLNIPVDNILVSEVTLRSTHPFRLCEVEVWAASGTPFEDWPSFIQRDGDTCLPYGHRPLVDGSLLTGRLWSDVNGTTPKDCNVCGTPDPSCMKTGPKVYHPFWAPDAPEWRFGNCEDRTIPTRETTTCAAAWKDRYTRLDRFCSYVQDRYRPRSFHDAAERYEQSRSHRLRDGDVFFQDTFLVKEVLGATARTTEYLEKSDSCYYLMKCAQAACNDFLIDKTIPFGNRTVFVDDQFECECRYGRDKVNTISPLHPRGLCAGMTSAPFVSSFWFTGFCYDSMNNRNLFTTVKLAIKADQ